MTPQASEPASRVVVIGAGLVGASIGCALTRAGRTVHLEDRVPSHAIVAAGRGAGLITPAPSREVALVVVAVTPEAVPDVVTDALARFPGATVTDVASIKASIIDALHDSGVDATRYVGSHPMAGSQHTGPLTADADLFVDRTWVVTPHAQSSSDAVTVVADLAQACGARTVEMPAEVHDRAVAQMSHLPQLMSSLTAGHLRLVPVEHLPLAGQGIRDVTRIAGSDPVLWRQIISANRAAIRTELEGVRADMDELLTALDDPDQLEAFLARGRAGARTLPGKHGLAAQDLVRVVIEIPDAPGSLARLFTDIEAAGVNVEDLQIEHDPVREVGFLAVDVTPEHGDRLTEAIRTKGWTLS
ncbi:prephenate dehydrogenase [Aestuariimicrobium ganziense]|uniref:prephenate dehydrogenase n=1 Tax=Aestuariimicrobium ganziense TaxID=2773677 RepID=UPI001940C851|nr:prephenate dehydrogenase [Aestuariimicrobium ganziense]